MYIYDCNILIHTMLVVYTPTVVRNVSMQQ